MNRKTFLSRSASGLLGCCAALSAAGTPSLDARGGQTQPAAAPAPDPDKQFVYMETHLT